MKEAKAIAPEERKSAVAAHKADIVLKQRQQLINSVVDATPRVVGLFTPWTGCDDFSLLSQYVMTHFSGDWAGYTAFCSLGRLPTAGVSW